MRWCLALLLATACTSPVVGAECREGLTACSHHCVDLSTDPENCGACGHVCAGQCVGGQCAPSSDAEVSADAGLPYADGGGSPDAGQVLDGGAPPPLVSINVLPVPVPVLPPGPVPTCDLGELLCSGTCVRPDRDATHCGSCDNACASGEVCAGGRCVPTCDPPYQRCGGVCVDVSADPDNCGRCGVRCSAGVCSAGMCQAPLAGHLVVIGHDYTTRRPGMSRLVGNAVLLPPTAPVQVLVFEGASRAAARNGTDAAIDYTATRTGRTWTRNTTDAASLSYRLASADVLLLYAQPALDPDMAATLGSKWSRALATFLQGGGTIVATVGAGTGGTLGVLSGAGLVGSTSRTDITGATVHVVNFADAVAVGVPLNYLAQRTSVRTELDPTFTVVDDGTGPVVTHRTFAPGP